MDKTIGSRQRTVPCLQTDPIGKTERGNVYIVPSEEEADDIVTFPGDVVVVDQRDKAGDDSNIKILYSAFISEKEVQLEILNVLDEYEQSNPTAWDRSIESMSKEWDYHNWGFFVSNFIPFSNKFFDKGIHVDLDNGSEGFTFWEHLAKLWKKRG